MAAMMRERNANWEVFAMGNQNDSFLAVMTIQTNNQRTMTTENIYQIYHPPRKRINVVETSLMIQIYAWRFWSIAKTKDIFSIFRLV
jgi:hypothetical protein